jgi:hypothetical protein
LHDEQIKAIVQVLGRLTEPAEEPKRRIGFHAGEESD